MVKVLDKQAELARLHQQFLKRLNSPPSAADTHAAVLWEAIVTSYELGGERAFEIAAEVPR